MASPDPIAVERQMYLNLLNIVDDPDVTLSQLRAMTGAGVDARNAAEAKSKAASAHSHGAADLSGVVKTVNGTAPDGAGNVTVSGGGGGSSSELSGTGSPEGVVTASPGIYYTDTNGTNGAWRWIKVSGTGNTGWMVVYGDTGWRKLAQGHNGSTAVHDSGTGLFIRRVNNMVMVHCNFYASGNVTVMGAFCTNAEGAGFHPIDFAVIMPKMPNPSSADWDSAGWPTGGATWLRGQTNFTTNAQWPSSLPGTPA